MSLLISSSKSRVKIFRIICALVAICMPQVNYASWYLGGSNLNLFNHYFPSYIKVGSSQLKYTTNGISLDGGYKFCIQRFLIAFEFDVGSFCDADGNLMYLGKQHYVNATYYLAIKNKIGYHISPNLAAYGLLGLSQNSIGDRVSDDYFNKKQVSFLYGGGLEYGLGRLSKNFKNFGVFGEWFYFSPSSNTIDSGGSGAASNYSMSVRGSVFKLGMNIYFDYC